MENRVVKILAIDDNKDNLTILRALIMESFPEAIVLTALSGQKGLQVADIEEPDVILLDIIMPVMDGYETCRKLKTDKKLCDIPVVFVTAIKSDKASRIKALESGADAFLTKPIDESELTAQIRAMLKIREANIEKRDHRDRLAILLEEKTRELVKSEAKYRQIAENVIDVVWMADMDMRTIYISPSVEKMLGESPEAHMRKAVEEKLTPESLKKMQQVFLEELGKEKDLKSDKNRSRIIEVEHYRADGSVIWVSMHTSYLRDENGKVIGFQGVSRDVTEQKKVQEKIAEQSSLLEKLPEQVPGVIYQYRYHPDGRSYFPYASRGIWHVYEVTPEEVKEDASMVFSRLHPDDYNHVMEGILESSKTLENWEDEYRVILPNKGERWVSGIAKPEKLKDGSVLWHGYISDITERKQAEEALNRSEASLQAVLNSAADGILAVGKDQRVLYASERFSELWRIPSDVLGSDDSSTLLQYVLDQLSDPEAFLKKVQELYGSDKESFDAIHFNDGRVFERLSSPLMAGPEVIGRVWSFRDITERKNIEEQVKKNLKDLLESQRIAHLGTWKLDLATDQVVWSEELYKMYGFDPALPPPPYTEHMKLFTPESWERLSTSLDYTRKSGIPYEMELETVTIDGSHGWIWVRGEAETDSKGNIIFLWGAAQDITESKRTESKLLRFAEELEEQRKELENRLLQSVNAISRIGEIRDAYTAGHQREVAELACAIGRDIGLVAEQIHNLSFGALIHDIGKFFIPSEILNKPGKISALEYQMLQTHVEESYNIVKEIDFPEEVHTMIYQHHERLDGSGYPQGISGDEIILQSRILAVADVVEAMTSHRPYRAALGIDAALEEIVLHRGTKYDAEVVDICVRLFKDNGFAL